jgi:hypothetical protein
LIYQERRYFSVEFRKLKAHKRVTTKFQVFSSSSVVIVYFEQFVAAAIACSLLCSDSELAVLNAPHVALLLNNGINKSVELAHSRGLLFEFLGSSGIGMKVGSFTEEVSTVAILRVDEHAVLV